MLLGIQTVRVTEKTWKTAAKVCSIVLGGLIGLALGAAAGAAVGAGFFFVVGLLTVSPTPINIPVFTACGAMAGALGGGLAGAFLGGCAGNHVAGDTFFKPAPKLINENACKNVADHLQKLQVQG